LAKPSQEEKLKTKEDKSFEERKEGIVHSDIYISKISKQRNRISDKCVLVD